MGWLHCRGRSNAAGPDRSYILQTDCVYHARRPGAICTRVRAGAEGERELLAGLRQADGAGGQEEGKPPKFQLLPLMQISTFSEAASYALP